MSRTLHFYATLAVALLLPAACLKSPSAPPTQEPSTITLSTYSLVFTALNERVRIDATVLDQDSKVIPDATVNWRSANRDVATVTDLGVVTATGNGATQIIVTSGDATASATVTVEQAEDSIEIMPASLRLTRVGETGQFTALVYDSARRIIPAAVVGWTSTYPEIASVDANGLVTAVSAGTTRVTAFTEYASVRAMIHVIIEGTEPEESSDRDVLIAFYHATDGPNWTDNTNWLSDEPLGEWFGVTTDGYGRVTDLWLTRNKLTGSVPIEISNLRSLVRLYIGGNDLTGQIPPELGRLGELEALSIPFSGLTGSIPPEIGQLRNLVTLSLFANQLNGQIPPEIGMLYNLQDVYLGNNKLSGPIPPEIGQLDALWQLFIDENKLSGPIPPEIGNLNSLRYLNLGDNRFSGGIPPEIGRLARLVELRLDTNSDLAGPLPVQITSISTLRHLDLAETGLCVPPDAAFRAWLDSIDRTNGITSCDE